MAWDLDYVTSIQTATLKWCLEVLLFFSSQFHFLKPLQMRAMRLFKTVIVILLFSKIQDGEKILILSVGFLRLNFHNLCIHVFIICTDRLQIISLSFISYTHT